MTTERELDEILAEIGSEHRSIGAPDRLESVLCAATGSRKRAFATPRMRLAWTLAVAVVLLAAVATAAVIWQARRSHGSQVQQAASVPPPQHAPEPIPASTRVAELRSLQPKSALARSAERREAGLHRSAPKAAAWNSLDEFVPLPVSEGLSTAGELSVVRVKLRGSDLQQYGLETPADAVAQTMMAEFVVGEDGLPRAIRILR
jgi:hypothetical protein